jgi:hypothetical protein
MSKNMCDLSMVWVVQYGIGCRQDSLHNKNQRTTDPTGTFVFRPTPYLSTTRGNFVFYVVGFGADVGCAGGN